MSNEVWFKHKPGLVIVGMPVHWKGWVLGLLFVAALLAITLLMLDRSVPQAPVDNTLQLGGWIAICVLTVSFVFAAWPHRGAPPE
jgi:hypothetical protein